MFKTRRMRLLAFLLVAVVFATTLSLQLSKPASPIKAATSSWPQSIAGTQDNLVSLANGGVVASSCTPTSQQLAFKSFSTDGTVGGSAPYVMDGYSNFGCDGATSNQSGLVSDKNSVVYGFTTQLPNGQSTKVAAYKLGTRLWASNVFSAVCNSNKTAYNLTPHRIVMGSDGNVYAILRDGFHSCDGSYLMAKISARDGKFTLTNLGTQSIDWFGAYKDGVVLYTSQKLRYIQYGGKELPPVDVSNIGTARVLTSTVSGVVFLEGWADSNGTCLVNSQYTTAFASFGPSGLVFRYTIPACWKINQASTTPQNGVALVLYDQSGAQQLWSEVPNSGKHLVHSLALATTEDYRSYIAPSGQPSSATVTTDINGNILLTRQYAWQSNGNYVGWQFTLYDQNLSIVTQFDTNSLDVYQGGVQNFSPGIQIALSSSRLYLSLGRCLGDNIYGCRDGSRYLYAVPVNRLNMSYPDAALIGIGQTVYKCPALHMFGVRGSGETFSDYEGLGKPVQDVKNNLIGKIKGLSVEAVMYPAVAVPTVIPDLNDYPPHYKESVTEGAVALTTSLLSFARTCQNTPVVLVAYSQGAQAVSDTLPLLPQAIQKQIAGVVLFGNPVFDPAQIQDEGTYDLTLYGIWFNVDKNSHQIPAVLAGRTVSYCLQGDTVCNMSYSNFANCSTNMATCPHQFYVPTWTQKGSDWLLTRLQK